MVHYSPNEIIVKAREECGKLAGMFWRARANCANARARPLHSFPCSQTVAHAKLNTPTHCAVSFDDMADMDNEALRTHAVRMLSTLGVVLGRRTVNATVASTVAEHVIDAALSSKAIKVMGNWPLWETMIAFDDAGDEEFSFDQRAGATATSAALDLLEARVGADLFEPSLVDSEMINFG